MTLRDWFAGQALASLCNAYNDENHASDNAKIAYANADAMIAQREVLNG
jgi:1,4-dihydroxy-2-naphthoate octaprenyltransferase